MKTNLIMNTITNTKVTNVPWQISIRKNVPNNFVKVILLVKFKVQTIFNIYIQAQTQEANRDPILAISYL